MSDWLDSWCKTRRLLGGSPDLNERPKVLPIEHSRYILGHGKKAYRQWMQKSAPALLCPLPSGESDPSVTLDCVGADTKQTPGA